MTERLAGTVAVITGATSGIGAATARRFVAEGARVVIAGRTEHAGKAIAAELGDRAVFVRTDVCREADIAAAVDMAVERFGRLDCLFSNAGAAVGRPLEDVTEAEFGASMRLLVGSAVFGLKHAVRVMKAAGGGSVINTSSIAAYRFGQASLLYSAAKAAVTHLGTPRRHRPRRLYLASDEASFVNGHDLVVDGGLIWAMSEPKGSNT